MTERWCKKCNKMCHCPNAEGECTVKTVNVTVEQKIKVLKMNVA